MSVGRGATHKHGDFLTESLVNISLGSAVKKNVQSNMLFRKLELKTECSLV